MIEADLCHAGMLAAMFGPPATPLSTPGLKEPGLSRERVHEPGAGPASAGVGARAGSER